MVAKKTQKTKKGQKNQDSKSKNAKKPQKEIVQEPTGKKVGQGAKAEKEQDPRKETIKTLMPVFLGTLAGIVSYLINMGGLRDPVGIIILVLFIYVNKFILPKFGIIPENKDWVVLSFLSLASWYISWTFLLNL